MKSLELQSKAAGLARLTDTELSFPANRTLRLTPKQRTILQVLFVAQGKPVPKSELLSALGYAAHTNTHTLGTHIYRIRQLLEYIEVFGFITTHQNGYRVAVKAP